METVMKKRADLQVVTDKVIIKQPGMNPWKKNLKRTVYTDGNKNYIRYDSSLFGIEIDGKNYREVVKYGDTWFLV